MSGDSYRKHALKRDGDGIRCEVCELSIVPAPHWRTPDGGQGFYWYPPMACTGRPVAPAEYGAELARQGVTA